MTAGPQLLGRSAITTCARSHPIMPWLEYWHLWLLAFSEVGPINMRLDYEKDFNLSLAHHDWSVVHARPSKADMYEMWVVSSKLEEVTAKVELHYISIKSGKEIKDPVIKKDVKIIPNGTTNILDGIIDNVKEEEHVLAARLSIDGKVIARDMDWPQPLKYLSFEDRGLEVSFDGHSSIRVKTDKPVKGLVFEEREGVLLSDSGIDVAPGDEQVIMVKHFRSGDDPLSWRYLGSP